VLLKEADNFRRGGVVLERPDLGLVAPVDLVMPVREERRAQVDEVHGSQREYRELEAGTSLPTFDTWDRICKLYGWSQSFVGSRAGNR
jgi:hypothetical protein